MLSSDFENKFLLTVPRGKLQTPLSIFFQPFWGSILLEQDLCFWLQRRRYIQKKKKRFVMFTDTKKYNLSPSVWLLVDNFDGQSYPKGSCCSCWTNSKTFGTIHTPKQGPGLKIPELQFDIVKPPLSFRLGELVHKLPIIIWTIEYMPSRPTYRSVLDLVPLLAGRHHLSVPSKTEWL